MKRELRHLGAAITYFTRIPLPGSWISTAGSMQESLRYLPLVGWIVGGAAALLYLAATALFPSPVAMLTSMAGTLLLTGALHEDGFADFLDGMGGGRTKEEVLRIMKDPRLGTYGTIGLGMLLAFKFFVLLSFSVKMAMLLLIAAHTVSRFATGTLIYFLPYARGTEGKAQPFAGGDSRSEKKSHRAWLLLTLAAGAIPALLPLLFLEDRLALSLLVPLPLVVWYMARTMKRRIGGYTGDSLGAVQQVTELTIYLTALLVTGRFPRWISI